MANLIASWKTSVYAKSDAQKVASEIMSLANTDNPDSQEISDVKPQDIVNFAKNENTELHKCFTWNKDLASEKWWLHEARDIVHQLVIVKVDEISGKQEPTSIRVFHRTDRVSGYKPTLLIMKNADEYEKMLKMAKEELRIFKNKYSSLSELEKVFDAIDEL